MSIVFTNFRCINWFRFNDSKILPIESVFITGENGAGKSSLLDGIMTLLRVSCTGYNRSARDNKTTRTLKGYVRCENRDTGSYWRSGHVTSYLLGEFYSTDSGKSFVLGVSFDSPSDSAEISQKWFYRKNISLEEINDDFFKTENGKTFVRRLDKTFPSKEKYTVYDTQSLARINFSDILGWGSYKDSGGLNNFEKISNLLLKSVAFKSSEIKNFDDFVTEYLLPEGEINVKSVIETSESSKALLRDFNFMEEKRKSLEEIVRIGDTYKSFLNELKIYEVLEAVAKLELTEEALKTQKNKIEESQKEIAFYLKEYEKNKDIINQKNDQISDISLNGGIEATKRRIDFLNKEIEKLKKSTQSFSNLINSFKKLLDEKQIASFSKCGDISYSQQDIYDELSAIVKELEEKVERYNEEIIKKNLEVTKTTSDINELEKELRDLEKNRFFLEHNTKTLFNEINRVFTEKNKAPAKLLYQLIDIKDKTWSDSIESLLRGTRLAIFVSPEDYNMAMSIYKNMTDIYNVTIIDTRYFSKQKTTDNENSVASMISSQNSCVSEYIRYCFNNTYLVEDINDIDTSKGKRFLSKNLFYYSNFSVKRLEKVKKMIGLEAIQERIAEIKSNLNNLKDIKNKDLNRISELTNYINLWRSGNFNCIKDPIHLNQNISNFYELIKNENEYKSLLEDSEKQELILSIDNLKKDINRLSRLNEELFTKKIERQSDINKASEEIKELNNKLEIQKIVVEKYSEEDNESFVIATQRYEKMEKDQRRNKDKLLFSIETIQSNLKNKMDEKDRELINKEIHYNSFTNSNYSTTGYSDINEYAGALKLVSGDIFEKTRLEFEQATMNFEKIVNNSIIEILKKEILEGNKYIKTLNQHLKKVNFMGNGFEISYAKPVFGKEKLFEAIMNKDSFSEEEYKEIIKDLVEAIISARDNEVLLRKLTNYKEYCTFEVKIKNISEGKTISLDKFCAKGSGSENQFPYYIILAAALSQLFGESSKSKEISDSSSLRIMIVDEAFDRTDKQNTKRLIEFIKDNFGIQLITSAPISKYFTVGVHMNSVICIKKEAEKRRIFYATSKEFGRKLEAAINE